LVTRCGLFGAPGGWFSRLLNYRNECENSQVMALSRLALVTIVSATTAVFSIGDAAADEPAAAPTPTPHDVSPALIGLGPTAPAPQPPPSNRKLWIALGVVSGAAVVGAVIAVGVTLGTSSQSNSVFHDWGTLTVTRR
jgi:hypothetical protein